jgi:ribonuclease P protein component
MPGFVLLVRERGDGDPAMRIGYTVTKKIGGAVVRNRMKRRFRALARELLPEGGLTGADHVLIGRAGGVERDFALLRGELVKALGKVKTPPSSRRGEGRGEGVRRPGVITDSEPPHPTLSPLGRGLERPSR